MTQSAERFTHARWLAAILLAGLVIRLGWGLSRPTDDASIDLLPDQRGYLELADNLLHGRGLYWVDSRFGQTQYAARMPGYPAFVALCGGSIRAVRIVQAVIDTSTALAVYLLARRMMRRPCDSRTPLASLAPVRRGEGSARTIHSPSPLSPALSPEYRGEGATLAPPLAAALVAFNPFLAYFSALLLTETLYTAMLAWAMVLMLHRRAWIAGVLLLVLGIHVRPSGIGLAVVLASWAVVVRGADQMKGRGRQAILAGAVVTVLTFVALLPWAWRNDRILGRWLWSTSNDGITAYDGLHPGATGATDQSFLKAMPHVIGMSELERCDYFAAEARSFARENPAEVARLALVKIARTWSPAPLSEEFGRPLYRAIALLYALPLDVLVIVGILRGKLPRSAVVFFLIPAIYYTTLHALSVGSLRYRVPAEPPLAILAAAGAARMFQRNKKEETAPS